MKEQQIDVDVHGERERDLHLQCYVNEPQSFPFIMYTMNSIYRHVESIPLAITKEAILLNAQPRTFI